jgi:hypothetical protein
MSRCLKDTEGGVLRLPTSSRFIVSLLPRTDSCAYHTHYVHTKPSTGCLTTTLAIQQMQLYVFIRTCSTYSLISFAGTLGVVHMQSSL